MTSKQPILSRLIFKVSPKNREAFEKVFDTELEPILKQYGLVSTNVSGRALAPDMFGRIYVHESIDHLINIKKQLKARTGTWYNAVQNHGDKLVSFVWEGYNDYWRFDPYVVPAGAGTRMQNKGVKRKVGTGKGHWKHYSVRDGLPSVNVMSMMTDRKGTLWFGTEKGVASFDSRKWRTLTTHNGLSGMIIYAMFEDRDGCMWFGSSGNGVSRFDGTHFENFPVAQNTAHNSVRDIVQDHEGNIWFATDGNGLCCYNGKTWTSYTTKEGLAHDVVTVLYEDSQQNLWVGTLKGLSLFNRHSKKTPFVSYTVKNGLPHEFVKSIVEDHQGHIWITTSGGIFQGMISPQLPTEQNANRELIHVNTYTIENGLPSNNLTCAYVDASNNLWFGTDGHGVVFYDGEVFHTLDTSNQLSDNFVKCICRDQEGHYWVGTGNGVNRYSGEMFWSVTTTDGLPSDVILALTPDKRDGMWIGTRKGAVHFDGKNMHTFDAGHTLQGNEVRHIFTDQKGYTWFAVHGGLTHYDGKTFTTYTIHDGLPHNQVQCVLEDTKGHIWCVFWQGRAVCQYDGKTFTTYTLGDGLTDLKMWTVFQDRKGTLWVGGHGGLSRFYNDRERPAFETFTKTNGLADNEVRNIIEDQHGQLWICTFNGLSMYNGKEFRSCGTETGLAHNEFRALLHTRSGDLWFGTYGAGVNRWRPEEEMARIQVLTDRDGLIGNRILSMAEDRKGAIWFGTSSGLTRFIQPDKQPPHVYVEAVVADRRYKGVSQLRIPTSAEVVSFEFASTSFKTDAENMCYRYRLKGWDETWQVTREERVEYSNLAEGGYGFEVYAYDRDLEGSLSPASVHIQVQGSKEYIAQRLKESNKELLQALATRDQLDARLRELNYLYALREKLSEAQTMSDILTHAGSAVSQALDLAGTVTLTLDDQVVTLGTIQEALQVYERPLVWNARKRGTLCVHTVVPLSESQEHTLLDETVSHLIHAFEARELESQLIQSARLVSMGQMAAGVAHELNQPLGAISTVVNDIYLRLQDGTDLSKEELSQMMKHAMGVVTRMSETINHLRIFSRDKAQTPPEKFDIQNAIESSIKLMGTQLKGRGIDLQVNVQTDRRFLLGHVHQIEQVIVNLLANARDAVETNTGEKQVTIKSFCTQDQVVLEVHDNGVGIHEDLVGRVFEPFFTTKEADKGTGLGLSISYAIVKNHGGEIVCESRLQKGTRFRVALPVHI